MVQRLPNPDPVPTSQEAGTSAGNQAAMTAPGSQPGISGQESGPQVPVSTQGQPAGEITTPVRWNTMSGVETRGGSGG